MAAQQLACVIITPLGAPVEGSAGRRERPSGTTHTERERAWGKNDAEDATAQRSANLLSAPVVPDVYMITARSVEVGGVASCGHKIDHNHSGCCNTRNTTARRCTGRT